MAPRLVVPDHVKYRREDGFGLVYDHEDYGEADATLSRVDETVVDALAFTAAETRSRSAVDAEFSPTLVDRLLELGFLSHA